MLYSLEKSLINNRFSQSNLFYGSKYTLRFTNALMCAKKLLSTSSLYENTENIYVILNRSLTEEISFLKDNLSLNIDYKSFNLLHSALINLILRLNYITIKENKENKIGISQDDQMSLYKIFDDFCVYKKSNSLPIEEINKSLKIIYKLVDKIKYKCSFSINDVRLFKELSGVTSINGKPKIFIIEGLEEASISSRNAFLKLLEEPPSNTYFIIITSSKEQLEQTILSRLALYEFPNVDEKIKNEIISSFNKDPHSYKTLEEFFTFSSINENIKNFAKKFKDCLVKNDKQEILRLIFVELKNIAQKSEDSFKKEMFLSISDVFNNDFENGLLNFSYYKKVLFFINKAFAMVNTYNQNLSNALFRLYYDLSEHSNYFNKF